MAQKKLPQKMRVDVWRALSVLGEDIGNARRRRRLTARDVAEPANISRTTLYRIEKGEPSTSVGAYANVLAVLRLLNNLQDLADLPNDPQGLSMELEALPQRVRKKKG